MKLASRVRILDIAAAAVMLFPATASATSHAHHLAAFASTIVQPATSYFTLRNKHDGRCLDEDVSTPTHDGTKVQAYTCNGRDNQLWYWDNNSNLRNKHDGRCLDEDVSTPPRDGTKVQVWTCNGWNNQSWYWSSDYPGSLRSYYDFNYNRCLDMDVSTPTRDGTRIQVYSCNNWPNQKWHT
jgi:hypothetical protein